MASTLPASSDYTDKDFDALRTRLFNLIRSVFPTWTDHRTANFGNLLVEMFAWSLDVLTFYQDAQAAEAHIVSATQRRNLLSLVKLLGYVPSGRTAAQATVTFTCDPVPGVGDSLILGGSNNPFPIVVKTLSSSDPVEFELQETVTLTPSITSYPGPVENSETHAESFDATGLPNQEVVLANTPFLVDALTVTVAAAEWTQVDHFLFSESSDHHYTVVVDNNDQATIRFGNNVSGAIPTSTIEVDYKTGGGAAGNVEALSIAKVDGSFETENGVTVTVTCSNTAAASGGSDRESEAEIRQNAPASIRTVTRTVSREDYETNAKTVDAVARALMLTASENGEIGENTGHLYVVPADSGIVSASTLNAVRTACTVTYPNTLTFQLVTKRPVYLDIDIACTVWLKSGHVSATVIAAIEDAFADYFRAQKEDGTDNELVNFGYYYRIVAGTATAVLPLSDLWNVVRDVEGVRKLGTAAADFTVEATRTEYTGFGGGVISTSTVLAAGTHADIPLQDEEFPRFSSVNVTIGT